MEYYKIPGEQLWQGSSIRVKIVETENDIYDVMLDVVQGKEVTEAVKREKIENLEEEVMKIVKEKPGLSANAYMGLVMQKLKGKVSGKEVMEILKRLVK